VKLCGGKRLRYAVAGCCLLLAATGCRFHQTGRGFIVRGQWSLECECKDIPRLSFAADQSDNPSIEQSQAKPELLRWRIRRRGYRLAARLFGRSEDPNDATQSALSEQVGELQLPNGVLPLPERRRPDLVLD